MKKLCIALVALLALACASRRPVPDSILDTQSGVASAGARLIAELGLDRTVFIQDGPLLEQGLLGLSQKWDGMYLITLEETLPPREKWMVMLHELAHVVVWAAKDEDTGHGQNWGLAYSKVYLLAVGGP